VNASTPHQLRNAGEGFIQPTIPWSIDTTPPPVEVDKIVGSPDRLPPDLPGLVEVVESALEKGHHVGLEVFMVQMGAGIFTVRQGQVVRLMKGYREGYSAIPPKALTGRAFSVYADTQRYFVPRLGALARVALGRPLRRGCVVRMEDGDIVVREGPNKTLVEFWG
jgi:hypothetical protein